MTESIVHASKFKMKSKRKGPRALQEDSCINLRSRLVPRNAEQSPSKKLRKIKKPDQCHIFKLNRDCMLKLFSFVNVKDLIRSERVSRKWQEFVLESLSYKRVFSTSYELSVVRPVPAVLPTLLRRFGGSLRRLYVDGVWCKLKRPAPQLIAELCPNLREVYFTNMFSTNWEVIPQRIKNLKSVAFMNCLGLDDTSLKSFKCEELIFERIFDINGDFFPKSEKTKLKKLVFIDCFNLKAKHLCNAPFVLEGLVKLRLDSCPPNVSECLNNILMLTPNLVEFSNSEMFHWPVNIERIAQLKQLQVLQLTRNCCLNDHLLELIVKQCKQLTTLDISGCQSYREFAGYNPEGGITEQGLCSIWQLHNIKHLNISGLPLTDKVTNAFVKGSVSKLETFVCNTTPVGKCGITRIMNSCRYLKVMDLARCRRIGNQAILRFSTCLAKSPCRRTIIKLYVKQTLVRKSVFSLLDSPLLDIKLEEYFCPPVVLDFGYYKL